MNEELRIKITAVVDQAKQAIKAVTNELHSYKEETDETAVSETNLSQKVKEQRAQLAQLKKEYANITATQGKQSAAALACSRQIDILSASYGANLTALSGASASANGFSISALGAATASTKLGTAANLSSEEFKGFMKAVRGSTESIDTAVEAASKELWKLWNIIEDIDNQTFDGLFATSELERMERQIEETEGAIREIGEAASDASVKVQKSVKDMADGFEDTKKKAKDTGGAMEKIKGGAAVAGKAVVGAFAAATAAVAGTMLAVSGLAESTREYRTEQAKLKTAFEASGHSAEAAKTTYNDLYRVLGDTGQATEAANLLAKLTDNEQELAEWTNIAQGVYATFGESLPIESLAEAANETAKTGEITGALADALNWAGVNEAEFAEQLFWANSEAEREKLIRTTLNTLYDEAATGYEENAASILAANEAQAKLTDSLAALGEAVEPIVTLFKTEFADALVTVTPHIQTFATGLLETLTQVEGGTEKMKESISGMSTSIITTITDALPLILAVGSQIIVAMLQGITENLPAILGAIMGMVDQILTAVVDLLPLLASAIMQGGAEIVVLLGELIPKIVVKIIEIIPLVIDSILSAVPQLFTAAVTFLMSIVQAIPKILPALVQALPQILTSVLKLIANFLPVLAENAVDLFMCIVAAIPEIIPPLIAALPGLMHSLSQGLFNLGPAMAEASYKLFMGIVTGLVNVGSALIQAAVNLVKSVAQTFVSGFKAAMKFEITLPKIKLPKFSVQPAGWQIGDLLKGVIPKLGITWNAKGGVFDKPTLMSYGGSLQGIGEAGAEAVVPLENNLEWLDKLANMLNQRMGGSDRPVVLQVDGKTFAKTVINTVNADTRQKGKIGLNIV